MFFFTLLARADEGSQVLAIQSAVRFTEIARTRPVFLIAEGRVWTRETVPRVVSPAAVIVSSGAR
jgi:hypothetical protein